MLLSRFSCGIPKIKCFLKAMIFSEVVRISTCTLKKKEKGLKTHYFVFKWFLFGLWFGLLFLKNHSTGKSMWWLSGIRVFYICTVTNLLLDEYGTSEGQQDKWHSTPSAVPLDRLDHPEVFYLSQPWFICEMITAKNDGFYFHMFNFFHGV